VKNIKSRIAVAATVLALGGLTGLALSADKQKASSTVATDPIVRTRVVHRTIHITRHAKPAAAAGPPAVEEAPETSPVAASGYSAAAPSATTASSGSYPETAPVTTATSGGGGGYASESGEAGEVEHEGEGADD